MRSMKAGLCNGPPYMGPESYDRSALLSKNKLIKGYTRVS